MFSGRSSRLAGVWAAMEAEKAAAAAQGRLDEGRTSALDAIGTGRTNGLAALGQGYDAARPEYQGAIDRFQPWTDAGTKALGTYQDSLGLNGAGGNANAVSQFQASPGYQWQQDQAADQIARKQSALGALGSGNTMVALQDRAQNIANQEYGGWQDRLNGLSNTGLQATGAQATLQKGLGDLGVAQGRDEANIYGTTGAQEAGLYSNFANLGANNEWMRSNGSTQAILGGIKNGQDKVMSGLNFGLGLAGTGLNLLGLGMGAFPAGSAGSFAKGFASPTQRA
jgi:hypothetical protein